MSLPPKTREERTDQGTRSPRYPGTKTPRDEEDEDDETEDYSEGTLYPEKIVNGLQTQK